MLPRSVLVVGMGVPAFAGIIEMLAAAGLPPQAVTAVASLTEARRALTIRSVDCVLLGSPLPDSSDLEGLTVLAAAAPTASVVVVVADSRREAAVIVALTGDAEACVARSDLDPVRLQALPVQAESRRRAGAPARRRRAQVAAVLDSIRVPAAVLDGSGLIVAVNEAWTAAALVRGAAPAGTGVGVNYLTVCDHAGGDFTAEAAEVAAGIRGVLRGDVDGFWRDYSCPAPENEAWAGIRVSPVGQMGGGALVIHVDITDLKAAEVQLRQDHEELISVLDCTAPVFLLAGADAMITYMSDTTMGLFHLSPSEGVGRSVVARLEGEDQERALACFHRVAARSGARERLSVRTRDGHGRSRTLDLLVANLLADPAVGSMVVTGSDVTGGERTQINQRLQARLLERLPAAVMMIDERDVVVYWNDQAMSLYGSPAHAVLGRPIGDLGLDLDRGAAREIMAGALANGREEGDCELRRSDGSSLPVHLTMEQVHDPDIGFSGVVGMAIDVRNRRALEEALAFQSLHDPMTGLPNHQLFTQQLRMALERAVRTGQGVGVVTIDLDDFESINVCHGEGIGDELIVAVSALLGAVVRPGDVVARLGGDEFAVCCDGIEDPVDAYFYAEGLLQSLAAPFSIGGVAVTLGASVGVAVSGSTSKVEEMLRHARAAMYHVKRAGKGGIELFDDATAAKVSEARQQAMELRAALEDGQIVAYFQPEVDLVTQELVGFEALARWLHPERGLIPPIEFIPLAEDHQLIGEVGLAVLRDACRALASWRQAAPDLPLTVAVNVSGRQLADRDLVSTVQAALAEFGISGAQLCMELTESTLVDTHLATDVLRGFKALGVAVAIDDFGTGYSSLARLHTFPLDFLKIDRSFVQALLERPDTTRIVEGVVALASALGLRTIAEGIETEEQARQLRAMGVDQAQGYLWGRPVDASEALRIVTGAAERSKP